jgi:hypothetical protein
MRSEGEMFGERTVIGDGRGRCGQEASVFDTPTMVPA